MALSVITGSVTAKSGVTIMGRIRGANGALITQASLSTIAYVVSDLTAGTTSSSTSATISSVVFDSLQQTDPRWTKDNQFNLGTDGAYGYNFAITIPATTFPISTVESGTPWSTPAQTKYQIDVIFTPVSGQPWRVVYQAVTTPVFA